MQCSYIMLGIFIACARVSKTCVVFTCTFSFMYRASFARRCLTNRFRSVQDILETRLCKHQKTSLQFAVIVVVAMLLLAHVVRDFHIQVVKKSLAVNS